MIQVYSHSTLVHLVNCQSSGGYKYKGAPNAGKEEIVADGEQVWWDASTLLDPDNEWECGISNAR